MINISCIMGGIVPLVTIEFNTVFSVASHTIFHCCKYVYKSYLSLETCK